MVRPPAAWVRQLNKGKEKKMLEKGGQERIEEVAVGARARGVEGANRSAAVRARVTLPSPAEVDLASELGRDNFRCGYGKIVSG